MCSGLATVHCAHIMIVSYWLSVDLLLFCVFLSTLILVLFNCYAVTTNYVSFCVSPVIILVITQLLNLIRNERVETPLYVPRESGHILFVFTPYDP